MLVRRIHPKRVCTRPKRIRTDANDSHHHDPTRWKQCARPASVRLYGGAHDAALRLNVGTLVCTWRPRARTPRGAEMPRSMWLIAEPLGELTATLTASLARAAPAKDANETQLPRLRALSPAYAMERSRHEDSGNDAGLGPGHRLPNRTYGPAGPPPRREGCRQGGEHRRRDATSRAIGVPSGTMDWGDPERPLHRRLGSDDDGLELAANRSSPWPRMAAA